MSDIEIGQIVRSRKGRDLGNYYLVLGFDTKGNMLKLVDGRKRTAANPKVKNKLHIQVENRCSSSLKDLILAGKTPTNEEIRNSLNQML